MKIYSKQYANNGTEHFHIWVIRLKAKYLILVNMLTYHTSQHHIFQAKNKDVLVFHLVAGHLFVALLCECSMNIRNSLALSKLLEHTHKPTGPYENRKCLQHDAFYKSHKIQK